jgi:uncharacterized UPF0160 family protein
MTTSIITHSGQFHADEVTAYTILKSLLVDVTLTRTRDKTITGDIFIDVGGVYDVVNKRFDHHQHDCNATFSTDTQIPLSSAGMIYKEYGKDFIKVIIDTTYKEPYDSTIIDELYTYIYKNFIIEIDAIDNGIANRYETIKYYTCTNISSIISKINYMDCFNHEEQLKRFHTSSELVLQLLTIAITHRFNKILSYNIDYNNISDAFDSRLSDGQILIMKESCSEWLKCLKECERNTSCIGIIKFIIFRGEGCNWRVRTISEHNFTSRKNLLTDAQLNKTMTNPNELVFIHKNLFIGEATTLESAIEIATFSLL